MARRRKRKRLRRSHAKPSRRCGSYKDFARALRFEPLEDRRMLAVFTVDNLGDAPVTALGDAPGTLRQAIFDANATSGSDAIEFAEGLSGTIPLNHGELRIRDSVAINGPGADRLTIDAQGVSRVFNINDGTPDFTNIIQVDVRALKITGGATTDFSPDDTKGAGIRSTEDLSLDAVWLTDNFAAGSFADGGGLYQQYGTLTIESSTISHNSANGGGGISLRESFGLIIANSTISNNEALFVGGGLQISDSFLNSVDSSTIVSNVAPVGGGVFVDEFSDVSFFHSILANNTRPDGTPDDGAGSFSASWTLIEETSGISLFDGRNVTTGIDPQLGQLRDNGGPTPTHAPLSGSPLIDAGDPLFIPASDYDQRGNGFERVVGGRIDLGAVEVQSSQTFFVDTLVDESDGDFSPGDFSLREAIELANATTASDVIEFAAGLAGTILLTQGELALTESVTIEGPGSDVLTIDASGNDPTPDVQDFAGTRVFNIDDGSFGAGISTSISGLTLTGGESFMEGGAIYTAESLALDKTVITGNFSRSGGGIAIHLFGGGSRVDIAESIITGNQAGTRGGGVSARVADGAIVYLSNSRITDNRAILSGFGGGIFAYASGQASIVISESTIDANQASNSAGGIFAAVNAASNASIEIRNSTISGNIASGPGGGIVTFSEFLAPVVAPLVAAAAVPKGISINHSTVTRNSAAFGGGIYSRIGELYLDHTIVADNDSGGDLGVNSSDAFVALSWSLIGNNTGSGYPEAQTADAAGNLIGSAANPIDARLEPLADNGGPTPTHALESGSPVIDSGNPSAQAGLNDVPLYDQRGEGFDRILGGRIDIGAFEAPVESGFVELDPTVGNSVFLSSLLDGTLQGVVVGDLVFQEFAYSRTGSMPEADSVLVSGYLSLEGESGITMQGSFLALNESADALLEYEVTVSPSAAADQLRIHAAGLVLGGGQVDFNSILSVDEVLLDGLAGSLNVSGAQGFIFQSEDSTELTSSFLSLPVRTDISAFGGAFARFTSLSQSFSVSVPAPISLSATEIASQTISLDWIDAIAAGSYIVERSTNEFNDFTEIAELGHDETSFVDSDPTLELGQTYFYRVKSVVNDRSSEYSDVVSVTLANDIIAPSVLNFSPQGLSNASIDQFTITFDESIDRSTFTPSQVTIVGPAGVTLPTVTDVTAVVGSDDAQFVIELGSPLPDGEFQIAIGTGISDLAGNPLVEPFQSTITIDTTPPQVTAGVDSASSGTVELFFSEEIDPNTFDLSDIVAFSGPNGADLLSTVTEVFLVGADAQITFAPPTLPGTYRLSVGSQVADFAGNLIDHDADGLGGEVGEIFEILFSIDGVDLGIGDVSAPLSAQLGRPIDVGWVVTNLGNLEAVGTWRDRVYLSTDDQLSADDRLLGEFNSPVPLAVTRSYQGAATVILPGVGELLPQAYYLLIETNATDTLEEFGPAENLAASAVINVVLPPLPDLVVTEIAAPSTAFSGEPFLVSWTLQNQGAAPVDGSFVDRVSLSDDAIIGGDITLGLFQFNDTLAPGESVTRTQQVAIPFGNEGEQRIVVTTDSSDQIIEVPGGSGNTAIDSGIVSVQLPPIPNLQVTHVTSPASSFSGQEIDLEWTVTNLGTGPTTTNTWLDSIFLSEDAVLDEQDVLLGSVPNRTFLTTESPTNSYVNEATVVLPEEILGPRYFLVWTDTSNQVFEYTDEGDNIGSSSAFPVQLTPPPDLQTTQVSAPTAAFSGTTIDVSWTVTNAGLGDTRTAFWRDRVYLSLNPEFDEAAFPVATLHHEGNLTPGESYTATTSITLPISAEDNYYVYVETDSFDEVFESAFEENTNRSTLPIAVLLTPPPDLEVVEILPPPTERDWGTSLTVWYSVKNQGPGDVEEGDWQDRLYLSEDLNLDREADILLASSSQSRSLNRILPYLGSLTGTIPVGLLGTFYVIVSTDDDDDLYEFSETNNQSFHPLQITIQEPMPTFADLRPTVLESPTSGVAGQTIKVDYQVLNQGEASTGLSPWEDRIYLSPTAEFSTSTAIPLQSRYRVLPLGVDEAYPGSFKPQLPVDVNGQHFLHIVTDVQNAIDENENENNNHVVAALPLLVESRPPDLVVEGFVAPSTATAGESLLVGFTVANRGIGETVASNWLDHVVISGDAVYGNDDDLILYVRQNSQGLDPEEFHTLGQTVIQLPSALSTGDYFLFAATDTRDEVFEGPSELNNTSSALPITVNRRVADLVVTGARVSASANSGEKLLVEWTVSNQGIAKTDALYWHDQVYLSVDQVLDDDDLYLGQALRPGPLDAGESYNKSKHFDLGIDLSGTYYVLVATDSADRVEEDSQEGNNLGVSNAQTTVLLSGVPDFHQVTVLGPGTAVAGRPFQASWTVHNRGVSIGLTGSWTDSLYLSNDQVFDPREDRFLGSKTQLFGLAAGGSYTSVVDDLVIPHGLSGEYYLFVVVDSSNRIYERGGEDNNLGFDPIPLNVSQAPPADLDAGIFSVPLFGNLGQAVQFEYTVKNIGSAPALGAWQDNLYISTDEIWDISDQFLATVMHRGDVLGGESYTETVTALVPGVLPGNYHVIVRSDIRNRIPETDDVQNNIEASLNQTALTVPTIELGVPYGTFVAEGQPTFYRVNVAAGETLVIDVDSPVEQAYTEIYVSHGEVPTRAEFEFLHEQPLLNKSRVIVPSTQAGDYYIQIRRTESDFEVPSNTLFTLIANTISYELIDVAPQQIGRGSEVTLEIRGSRLAEDTAFALTSSAGSAIQAKAGHLENSSLAYATFDTSTLAIGEYQLSAFWSNGRTDTLSDAITVVANAPGKFVSQFAGPAEIRPGRVNQMQLEYGNSGKTDLYSPLAILTTNGNTPFSLLDSGFHTETLFLMALSPNGSANVLRPGQSSLVPFDYQTPQAEVKFQVDYITVDDQRLVNIDNLESGLRPSGLTDSQWAEAVERLIERISNASGTGQPTFGGLVKLLGETANDLAARGRHVPNARELLVEELGLALQVSPGAISGRLTDGVKGGPLTQNLVVEAIPLGELADQFVGRILAVTDAEGRFLLQGAPAGEYQLRVFGYSLPDAPTVTVNPATTSTFFAEALTLDWTAYQRDLSDSPQAEAIDLIANASYQDAAFALALADYAYCEDELCLDEVPTGALPKLLTDGTMGLIIGANGFGAQILEDAVGNLIVTFRGTDLTSPSDWWNNIDFLNPQWNSARERIFAEVTSHLAENPDAKVFAAGHSLGGGLAQLFVYDAIQAGVITKEQLLGLKTFNGVGIAETIWERGGDYEKGLLEGVNVTHYAARGDIVVRLGRGHLGGLPTLLGDQEFFFFNSHTISHLKQLLASSNPSLETMDANDYFSVSNSQRLISTTGRALEEQFGDAPAIAKIIAGFATLYVGNKADLPFLRDEWSGLMHALTEHLDDSVDVPDCIPDYLRSEIRQVIELKKFADPFIEGADEVSEIVLHVTALLATCLVDDPVGTVTTVGNWLSTGVGLANSQMVDFGRFTSLKLYGAVTQQTFPLVEGLSLVDFARLSFADEVDLLRQGLPLLGDKLSAETRLLLESIREDVGAVLDGIGTFTSWAGTNLVRTVASLGVVADVGCLLNCDDQQIAEASSALRRIYQPRVVVPVDPNDLLNPAGFGDEHWVTATEPLDYTIRFENDPLLASASAQVVKITHDLDDDLDARTFRLGNIQFGDTVLQVPANRSFYQERVSLQADAGTAYLVDVLAGIDSEARQAFWEFTTIDPATGDLPVGVELGFLPVNDTFGSGEGSVQFSLQAKEDLESGGIIDALATITFDNQAPIDTPPVFNTLDAGIPTSQVDALPATTEDVIFEVSWTGEDDATGSGLASFDIYAAVDDSPYEIWLQRTTLSSAPFVGEAERTYRFFSVARDNAGNVEELATTADATIVVPEMVSPQVTDFVVQDGASGRSYVDKFTIDFDELVNAADLIVSGDIVNAITLSNLGVVVGTDTPAPVPLTPEQFQYEFDDTLGVSRLTWSLDAFSGTTASLEDGLYELSIDPTLVTDQRGNQLDGNSDGLHGGEYTAEFHRLHGDVDGSLAVDVADQQIVNNALGSFPGLESWNPEADLDRDGRITVRDRLIVFRNDGNEIQLPPSAPAAGLAGDFDSDGDVDGGDFLAWQRGFGTQSNSAVVEGGMSGEQEADQQELAVWVQNFGTNSQSIVETPSLATLAVVSEPSIEENLLNNATFSAEALAAPSLQLPPHTILTLNRPIHGNRSEPVNMSSATILDSAIEFFEASQHQEEDLEEVEAYSQLLKSGSEAGEPLHEFEELVDAVFADEKEELLSI